MADTLDRMKQSCRSCRAQSWTSDWSHGAKHTACDRHGDLSWYCDWKQRRRGMKGETTSATIRTKKRRVSVEWSDPSSLLQSHHPFLISNWHTGIFMRGRENISADASFSLSPTGSQQIAQPAAWPRLVPRPNPPAEAWAGN